MITETIDRAYRRFPCGREVCLATPVGRVEYALRTFEMADRQNWVCPICSQPMDKETVTFDHVDGRGMGAGKRDDRIVKDGKQYNFASHALCNAERGSRREI